MKRIFYIGIVALCLLGCTSESEQITTDLGNAVWIGDAKLQPVLDSLMYEDDPAPLFRKEFVTGHKIKSATLFITAAGYYSASVNGKILDKYYCDPAWTDFRKRIYYSEYDIREYLIQGNNCIGVTLGNGFYNSLPMTFWGRYNLRDALATGRPMLIARVKIEYTNGKTEEIITDNTWKFADGPVIRNNVYLGEVYDARKEIKGWNLTGFIDEKWVSAIVKEGPGGKLQKSFFPQIQVIDVKKPLRIVEVPNSVYVADMGVNFTGTFKIRMRGKAGDTIRFRFGERIYDNNALNPMTAVAGQIKSKGKGGPGAPSLAAQGGIYIFGEDAEVEYCPLLSFRVYRYMEISGLKSPTAIDDIEGIALSSNVERNNSFSTSNNLVNSVQGMIVRTFLSNLMSVPSDCPGREKFGYGGDLQATNEAFICNFNMQSFYRKVLYDWVDGYQDSVFIDAVPYVGLKYCGLNFEAAIFDVQYNLYQYYGDTAIVRELYDFDLKWMDKAARIHPSGIVDKGLSDHEALVNVPVQLLGTAAYLKTTRIMKEFAFILKDKKNGERFAQLEEKIKAGLRDMYWGQNASHELIDKQSREASMAYISTLPEQEKKNAKAALMNAKNLFNQQTLYTLLLYCDVIPEKDQKMAVDLLLKAIDEAPSKHFTTGIFGTKYIVEVLSRFGHADRVFDIVNSTEFPGWGFMIKNGATTQWETWKESDDIYSNCHPMFGSVSAWFYRWLAGVRPIVGTPGFKRFLIAPSLPKNLSSVKCTYESPQGTIVANWDKKGSECAFTITVPKGSVATFQLPFKNPRKVIVKKVDEDSSFTPEVDVDGTCNFDLVAGHYLIVSE